MAFRSQLQRSAFREQDDTGSGGYGGSAGRTRQRSSRDPFEVRLTDQEQQELAYEVSCDIDDAESARATLVGSSGDIDRWHRIYEGGDRKLSKDTPWPGAANLTSYIGTEKVDALRARIMQTIFTDPMWVVEGWGEASKRAAFVERFHQWKAEEERLQTFVGRAIHNSLIEGTGVLEVSERAEWRRIRATIQAALQMDPMSGGPMMDPMTGMPQFARDEQGLVQEVQDPQNEAYAETTVDRYVRARRGPQYRVLGLKDFFLLPGHAFDRAEVFGYAKRFWRRTGQLKAMAEQGIYNNVEALGENPERDSRMIELRAGQGIAPQIGDRVEKELWEVPILKDLDKDGIEEWYVVTISRNNRVMLRIQRDDLAPKRYLLFVPFPRPDSLYGYSFIGHKLGTIIDEHTAQRNAIADRSSLVNSAPLLRVVGSLWDPYEQPFGPRAVIDVRDVKEIFPLQIPDVPGSMVDRERTTLAASERLSGLNDATLGVNPSVGRTATEYSSVTQQSFIRIDEVIRNLQETLEDLWLVRHEIWRRTLREGSAQQLPGSLVAAVEERGYRIPDNQLTAELLDGPFRGKPFGSVETADLNRQRQDFIGFLQALAQLVQAVPGLQMLFSQMPAAQSILRQAMRVFRWEDRPGLLGAPDEFAGDSGMIHADQPAQGMMPPGQPGMGQGAPPGAPAPQLPALLSQMQGR